MLQFIFGRAGFGKTFKIQEIIKENLHKNTTKLMLIVPEQSSFDTEKNILDLFGAKLASRIQVSTFTRLVDLVSREFGVEVGKKISKGDRNLLMSLAIDEVKDQLEIYSGQVGKSDFVELMVSALSEFKMCNVTNNSLLEISANVNDSILKEKLQETSLILGAYEALLKNTYIDPLDELTRLAQKLSEHDFFNEYTVFVDGFDGFTMQQFSILEIILKQCKTFYVALCTDESAFLDNELSIFSSVNRTAKKILNLAKKNNIEIKIPIYLANSKKFKSESLRILEKQIFRVEKEKLHKKINDVLIFSGNSKYDEADFVCRKIKQLIYTGEYKYNDFAVITRNSEIYRGILDVAFESYEIPYFMDRREEISTKPLVQLAIFALETINSNFSSQNIFKYLKTGLTGATVDEISKLENYVLFWNINGKMWLSEFTANPDGYESLSEKTKEKLVEINYIREKILIPLLKLKQNLFEATGDVITRKLYNFLCDINIIENFKNFCVELSRVDQKTLAEEQIRLWDLLVEILEKMEIILKNRKITPEKYTKLLKLMISSYDIAFTPRKIDEVIFGSVDRIRAQDKKIVFLIGAVEGEFPRNPVVSGIFTDNQRKQLILQGLPLYDTVEGLALNERFWAYKTVTMASEKLYITWASTTTLGGTKSASAIVREVKFILPDLACEDDFSEELADKIWAIKPAFDVCAKYLNKNSRFSSTLKEYFFRINGFRERLEALENINSYLPFKIENTEKITTLFGKNMQVSASQIEKFYLCKFSYFCQYGLLAKERKKASFDALQYGNVMHFIFEKILKKFTVENLLKFSKKELFAEVKNILTDFVVKELGGWTDKTARFKHLFSRLLNAVVPLLEHLTRELSQSQFGPIELELEISEKSAIKPLEFRLSEGKSILVGGKIDRVDVMSCENKDYVRILDYKTGAKEFTLSDILYGLNLQILIYLEIFCKNFASKCKKMVPAGVLYLPLTSTALNLDRDENFEKLVHEKMKKLRMNGLILDDKLAILGMEPAAKGQYIPVLLRDGQPKGLESLATVVQMDAIFRHINRLIISMGEQLLRGNIDAQPVKGRVDACEFCEYKSVCVSRKNENGRKIENFSKDEFFEKLELAQKGDEIDGCAVLDK